jgi:hypothetical protein
MDAIVSDTEIEPELFCDFGTHFSVRIHVITCGLPCWEHLVGHISNFNTFEAFRILENSKACFQRVHDWPDLYGATQFTSLGCFNSRQPALVGTSYHLFKIIQSSSDFPILFILLPLKFSRGNLDVLQDMRLGLGKTQGLPMPEV